MENFDLRKFINDEKASFLSEEYDEFQRVDKGKKGVAKKDKGEEEVYGAGVKKGEKLEKEKLTKEATQEIVDYDFEKNDIPSIKITLSDDIPSSGPEGEFQISALYHSGDNGKMSILQKHPGLQKAVTALLQKEFQKTFRKVMHGVLGKPFGLKETSKEEKGATAAEEDKFHKELDTLVHDTFGHSSDEKKKMTEEMVSKALSDAIDSWTDDEKVRKAAKAFAAYKLHKKGPDPLKDLDDETYHKALDAYRDAKNMNEIGMFHDPRMSGNFSGADDKWKNGAYHVRYRMLKNKGVDEEKAKELADTYEDKPWEEVKRLLNLNEVNIFDINPAAKKALEKLMAKGMSEKDARAAISDQMNVADRESERDEKRAFNLDEKEVDPYDDYEMPGEKWLEEEEEEKKPYSLGQALFLLSDENEKEVRAWKRKIADDIKTNGTGKYLKWSAKNFVDDFKKSLDEINEQMLDSETAIKKFLGYLIKPETMRRVGNSGNFVAKTRTGKVVLIEITPSGGGAIVYELDKEGKKLAKLDRVNWGYPSLDK